MTPPLVGAFSVITNLRMELFGALVHSEQPLPGSPGVEVNILVPAYPHHGVEVDAVTGGRALDG